MIVDLSDSCRRSCANVSETTSSFSVGTDRTVIHVAFWWLNGFVDGGAKAFVRLTVFALAGDASLEVTKGSCVPSYTQTVGIEETITRCGFMLCSNLVGEMGDETWKIVVIYLIGERVLRCYENIRE